ncbi:hypothetical protein [Bacteroides sp.]|uniref:hypothetical protein n=1 Tax=Bacteroides sp. TaxID=29523 RepID=UPI00263325DE|nr:hypothetical protein [Bacteroides sp.]MDD3038314.1 hypothetical protein [Bacteroides sp.]
MKKYLIVLLWVIFNSQLLQSQEIYTPLDSIPEWVKNKVTVEEYNLWKIMSSVFRIDYSFLKQDISSGKRLRLYDNLRQICNSIKSGEYSNSKGEQFTISIVADVDTTLNWKFDVLFQIDDNIQFCKRNAVIYQVEDLEKVQLSCEIWYIYNSLKKDAYIIKYDVLPVEPLARFQGSVVFSYQKELNQFEGSCAGTFQYYDKWNKEHFQNLNKSFAFSPQSSNK